MQCPQCRFKNPDKMQFCGKCGASLAAVCTTCGFSNPADFAFCGKCGTALASSRRESPIDFSRPQSYTPKHLADKILTTRGSIEGERKLVTVLFADVADFTALSKKLDPEEVHQIMDGCFKILMDEIHRHEGAINQFTGDGVMALFGAPVAHEDHARRACHAALNIQKALKGYAERIERECGVAFKMRVGLNSGPVIVGAIGDDLRMDYTAVGDTTNLAARMESLARPETILASVNTHRLTRDFFEFESMGGLAVKGKEKPQKAFRLIGAGEVATRIGASAAKGLTRFVGRKKSMAAVMEAYDKAESGTGQVLGIVGDAGVGKSRLLLEMRNVLSPGEYVYLEGQCLHYGGSMAYLPLLDILRSFFNIHEGDREYVLKKRMKETVLELDQTLVRTLSPFQEVLSLKGDDELFDKLDPREKREKTFEAMRDLFIRISQNKPLILVVEDLHWMDRTSNEFLDYLIGWLANTAILLILLYRPEYTHQWASKSFYTQVNLDQLNPSSSTELIKAMLEEGDVAPELKQLILTRASGNPLYMEEFTHTLLENGAIEKKENRYVLCRDASDIRVPDTIQGIIAARMDRLEDNIKRTMQVASVIGRDFAFRILQTITGMRAELKSYLLNLQGLEFIYEKKLFPELEYMFKHALTQEVAYNSLLVKRRKEIHEKIGRAIEQIYAERLEEFYEMLAYHYAKGESPEKACHYFKLSGDKATKNYAHREAFDFYKQAISALDRMPETEASGKEQITIRQAMAGPMTVLNFPEDSLEILLDGERLALEVGDSKSVATFTGKIITYHTFRGELLQAIRHVEKGLYEAEKMEDIDLIGPIGPDLVTAYMAYGDADKAANVASKVIHLLEKNRKENEFFEKSFNTYVLIQALNGYCLALLGRFEEGAVAFEKALSFARRMDHPASVAVAELYYSTLFNTKGDGKNTIKYAESAHGYFSGTEVTFLLQISLLMLGFGYYLVDELKTARIHTEGALHVMRDMGFELSRSSTYGHLSRIHLGLGEVEKAQAYADSALDSVRNDDNNTYQGITWAWLGHILGKKRPPEFERAEEYILKGIQIAEEFKLRPFYSQGYLALGELYDNMGRRDDALRHLKKAEENFSDMGMDYYLKKTRNVLNRLKH